MWPTTVLTADLFPASAKIFIGFHVEPHGEEEQLEPRDDEEGDEDDRGARDRVARDTEPDLEAAEQKARAEEQHPQRVEEDQGVEVADDVLLLHPPEEALRQEPGDLRDDVSQTDAAPLADAVDGARGIVAYAAVPDIQVDEQVVGEAVALVDAVEVEQLERLEVHGRVARLRVRDMPVAGRDLRQEGEHGVPQVARARDELPSLAGEEPVCLGVVDLVGDDA